MTIGLFNKNRYIFSKRKIKNKKVLDEDKLAKEIRLLKGAFRKYNIKLKYLYRDVPNISKKNIILNVAKYICERKTIIARMKKNKELPLVDIAFETGLKLEFINRYKYYILGYTLLFLDDKFSEIVKYLRIEFRELDELSLVPVVDNTESNLSKGIAIAQFLGKVIILTDQGEFIRIMDNDEWQIGSEAVGREYLGLKPYRKKIVIISTIILGSLFICSKIYGGVVTTILMNTTSEVRIEVNRFNKVVSAYSPTERGKEMLNSIKLKNKSVDKSISEILVYAENNKMIPQSNSINLSITGEALNIDGLNEMNQLITQKEKNTEKYSLVINNSGEQVILKP